MKLVGCDRETEVNDHFVSETHCIVFSGRLLQSMANYKKNCSLKNITWGYKTTYDVISAQKRIFLIVDFFPPEPGGF